jgi:V8-like Glu-specific endopeptidase
MRRGAGCPRTAKAIAARAARRTSWLVVVLTASLGAYAVTPVTQAASGSAAQAGQPFSGTPEVGALFSTSHGQLVRHFCTASVVSSPAKDLLITAAHCLQGRSLRPIGRIVFAPGYHDGKFPYSIWKVTTVYVDSAWSENHNPNNDVAFLIAGRPGTHIQTYTGAETLKINQPAAQVVRVIGYPDATSEPITCTAAARGFRHGHQMVFGCDNYTNGTSGGPFLAHVNHKTGRGWVIGVIGGFQEGGDTPSVSYSPRFFSRILALYRKAVTRSMAAGSENLAAVPG